MLPVYIELKYMDPYSWHIGTLVSAMLCCLLTHEKVWLQNRFESSVRQSGSQTNCL